jgi:hypothetical protein
MVRAVLPPDRRFTGPSRLLRGVVLGSAVLVLTAVAHTAGGSTRPDVASMAWLLPLAVVLSTVLADRRRSRRWLVAYLLGAQGLFHVLLVTAMGHAGHGDALLPPAPMLVGHVVAAIAAALVLEHADQVLHQWLVVLGNLIGRRFTAADPIDHASAASRPATSAARPLIGRLAGSSLCRRGPPLTA